MSYPNFDIFYNWKETLRKLIPKEALNDYANEYDRAWCREVLTIISSPSWSPKMQKRIDDSLGSTGSGTVRKPFWHDRSISTDCASFKTLKNPKQINRNSTPELKNYSIGGSRVFWGSPADMNETRVLKTKTKENPQNFSCDQDSWESIGLTSSHTGGSPMIKGLKEAGYKAQYKNNDAKREKIVNELLEKIRKGKQENTIKQEAYQKQGESSLHGKKNQWFLMANKNPSLNCLKESQSHIESEFGKRQPRFEEGPIEQEEEESSERKEHYNPTRKDSLEPENKMQKELYKGGLPYKAENVIGQKSKENLEDLVDQLQKSSLKHYENLLDLPLEPQENRRKENFEKPRRKSSDKNLPPESQESFKEKTVPFNDEIDSQELKGPDEITAPKYQTEIEKFIFQTNKIEKRSRTGSQKNLDPNARDPQNPLSSENLPLSSARKASSDQTSSKKSIKISGASSHVDNKSKEPSDFSQEISSQNPKSRRLSELGEPSENDRELTLSPESLYSPFGKEPNREEEEFPNTARIPEPVSVDRPLSERKNDEENESNCEAIEKKKSNISTQLGTKKSSLEYACKMHENKPMENLSLSEKQNTPQENESSNKEITEKERMISQRSDSNASDDEKCPKTSELAVSQSSQHTEGRKSLKLIDEKCKSEGSENFGKFSIGPESKHEKSKSQRKESISNESLKSIPQNPEAKEQVTSEKNLPQNSKKNSPLDSQKEVSVASQSVPPLNSSVGSSSYLNRPPGSLGSQEQAPLILQKKPSSTSKNNPSAFYQKEYSLVENQEAVSPSGGHIETPLEIIAQIRQKEEIMKESKSSASVVDAVMYAFQKRKRVPTARSLPQDQASNSMDQRQQWSYFQLDKTNSFTDIGMEPKIYNKEGSKGLRDRGDSSMSFKPKDFSLAQMHENFPEMNSGSSGDQGYKSEILGSSNEERLSSVKVRDVIKDMVEESQETLKVSPEKKESLSKGSATSYDFGKRSQKKSVKSESKHKEESAMSHPKLNVSSNSKDLRSVMSEGTQKNEKSQKSVVDKKRNQTSFRSKGNSEVKNTELISGSGSKSILPEGPYVIGNLGVLAPRQRAQTQQEKGKENKSIAQGSVSGLFRRPTSAISNQSSASNKMSQKIQNSSNATQKLPNTSQRSQNLKDSRASAQGFCLVRKDSRSSKDSISQKHQVIQREISKGSSHGSGIDSLKQLDKSQEKKVQFSLNHENIEKDPSGPKPSFKPQKNPGNSSRFPRYHGTVFERLYVNGTEMAERLNCQRETELKGRLKRENQECTFLPKILPKSRELSGSPEKCMERLKNTEKKLKEQFLERITWKEQQETAECSFNPDTSATRSQNDFYLRFQSRELSPESIYQRTTKWKERLGNRLIEQRKQALLELTRPEKPSIYKGKDYVNRPNFYPGSQAFSREDLMDYEVCEANQIFECIAHNFQLQEKKLQGNKSHDEVEQFSLEKWTLSVCLRFQQGCVVDEIKARADARYKERSDEEAGDGNRVVEDWEIQRDVDQSQEQEP